MSIYLYTVYVIEKMKHILIKHVTMHPEDRIVLGKQRPGRAAGL